MAIDYTGHCRLPPAETQRRIVHLRATRPEWFDVILLIHDARAPSEPFGREIAREFGIEAQSTFLISVNDKVRSSAILRDALELTYRVFGTDDLVITWGLDFIHPPREPHRAMQIS